MQPAKQASRRGLRDHSADRVVYSKASLKCHSLSESTFLASRCVKPRNYLLMDVMPFVDAIKWASRFSAVSFIQR